MHIIISIPVLQSLQNIPIYFQNYILKFCSTKKQIKWHLYLALQNEFWLFCFIVLISKIQIVRYLIVFYIPCVTQPERQPNWKCNFWVRGKYSTDKIILQFFLIICASVIINKWRPFILLVNSILLYISRNCTQDSLSSTADQPLILWRCFCLWTDCTRLRLLQ